MSIFSKVNNRNWNQNKFSDFDIEIEIPENPIFDFVKSKNAFVLETLMRSAVEKYIGIFFAPFTYTGWPLHRLEIFEKCTEIITYIFDSMAPY
jgi:hypothetical protein